MHRHRTLVAVLAWGLLAAAATAAPPAPPASEHTTDTPAQIRENLAKKYAVLVDVRESEELKGGILAGAIHMPNSLLEKATADEEKAVNDAVLKQLGGIVATQIPKEKVIYTYCASGVRSVAAAKVLRAMGYDVRPLKAGYKELVQQGFARAGQEDEKK